MNFTQRLWRYMVGLFIGTPPRLLLFRHAFLQFLAAQ